MNAATNAKTSPETRLARAILTALRYCSTVQVNGEDRMEVRVSGELLCEMKWRRLAVKVQDALTMREFYVLTAEGVSAREAALR